MESEWFRKIYYDCQALPERVSKNLKANNEHGRVVFSGHPHLCAVGTGGEVNFHRSVFCHRSMMRKERGKTIEGWCEHVMIS